MPSITLDYGGRMTDRKLIVTFDTGDRITYNQDTGQVHSFETYEPAVITTNNVMIFFKEGKLHRTTGPAYFGPNNLVEYWLDGKQYTHEEWDLITNHSDHYP